MAIINTRRKNIIFFSALISILFLVSIFTFSGCSKSNEIELETEPQGANVYIDGKLKGKAPLNFKLYPAPKKIRIEFKDNQAVQQPEFTEKKISKTLTAAYIPLTANLPFFVALDKGYFEKNGVKVNAIEATSPNDIVTGIVAGKIDFAGVLAYSIIFPAANRYPESFKLFASCEETSTKFTSSIVTLKESSINSYEDLKGKKIGVYTGLVQINFLKAILTGIGIDPSEVEIIEISPRLQIQGLISGEYDALSSTEPTVNIAKQKGLIKIVTENPRVKYIMCPFPSAATPISMNLLNQDPESALAVIKAFDMAVEFINSHPKESKKSLLKFTPIPQANADAVLEDLKLFKYCKLGEENRLNVQRFADYLYENGIMKERIENVNKLFGDNENGCIK